MIPRNSFWLIALFLISGANHPDVLKQGTDEEPRTVILISIDGLRADYITPEDTPHLYELAGKGVHAEYLEPVFPSKTFPNHYSIITGLYPANHGIINNSMYDSGLGSFRISDRDAITKSAWWGGEPLWITVQKHGHTSATYFWVGSDADSIQGTQPTYWMEYDHDLPHDVRIDSVMAAVTRTPRPALITTYFSTVDTQGHRTGPNSSELRETLKEVDQQIGNLLARLQDAGLYENINIVVLGDHGMAETSSERVELVDDYINLDDVYMIGGLDALGFFNLKDPTQLDTLLSALNQMSHARWFTRDNIPAKWHYSGNDRIPDLIGIADEGWQMSSTQLFERNPGYYSGGTHGYDPALPSMHAAFIAHGPQFKQNLSVDGFSLVHVYELLCAVIGIESAPNDGNLEEVKHLLRQSPQDVESPDMIVQALYDVISTPGGQTPDWERWDTLFIPEARLIAIGSNEAGEDLYRTWTPEEYKEEVGAYLEANPFFEVEVSHTSEQFGNMVHRFSTYESYRSMDEPPFSRGINSIQLVQMEGRWWIVTIFWQPETSRFPLPEEYLLEK